MSLADRIAVMNFAVLQQFDTPHNVYHYPRNIFVANFIGSPTINFFEFYYYSGSFELESFQERRIPISQKYKTLIEQKLKHDKIVLGIRPEHLKVGEANDRNASTLRAKVVSYEPLGTKTIVYMHPDKDPTKIVKSSMESDYKPRIGDVKHLIFDEDDLYLFDKETTELLLRFGG